jgi:hypothetical protein
MQLSGTHSAYTERELRGYHWLWPLQIPQHPQPIPGSVNTTIITRQELPWHPRSLLINAAIEPSPVITFRDFSFHPPYSALGLRLRAANATTALTVGRKGYATAPFTCQIKGVMLVAGQAGSAVFDIYRLPLSEVLVDGPPGPNSSIISEAEFRPTLNGTQTAIDMRLNFWNTTLNQGDVLCFDLLSCTGISTLTLTLLVARNSQP